MRTEIYWIETPTPGRLAIMPRPRGGDWLADEVASWRSAGIDIVLSLLTPGEVSDLELLQEKSLCEATGIRFLTFPIDDRSVPASREATLNLLTELARLLAEGMNVAIHCRQGIGRAPLIAIGVLVLAGLDRQIAKKRVSAARGVPVPETVQQDEWIAALVKDVLASAPK
jgi:Cyclin-dependent kinase inhibitor 3 (CDKN3)